MNYYVLIFVIFILTIYFIFFTRVLIDNFNQWQDKIDAYIYINLENREDRKKLLLDEFKKLDIPEDKIRKISGVRIPKNGHKGCIQSHILALQMAKLNNWKTVAIFEDDAEITVDIDIFKNMVKDAMSVDNWDMIILHGANQSVKENGEIEGHPELHYLKHSTQSTGYIIKNTYYDKLLNLFIHCNDMMSKDNWEVPGSWEGHALDQQWNKLVEKDNWIGFKNNLLKQRAISSSINS
jgi:hypothetical protein